METLEYKVLDKGFVKLLDIMGDDNAITDAARVSTGNNQKEKTKKENERLIRYLWRNLHTSPFEMVELKFYCKMPVLTARQWIRHRTANVNEISGRYSILASEFYEPEVWRQPDSINKQGSQIILDSEGFDEYINSLYKTSCEDAFKKYEEMIAAGVANEMARMHLPVSTYTEWYWKIDLRNLLHFLNLRLDFHAQYEIRVYAEAMADIVKRMCPMAWKAFEDYTLNAVTFSAQEWDVIKKQVQQNFNLDDYGNTLTEDQTKERYRGLYTLYNQEEPSKVEIAEFFNKIK